MEKFTFSQQFISLLNDDNTRKQFLEIACISASEGIEREEVRQQLLSAAGGLMVRFCDLQIVRPLLETDDETYSSLVGYAYLLDAVINNLVTEHEYEH